MISYELEKKLKDAGFPQEIKAGDFVVWKDKTYIHLGGGHNGDEGLYAEKSFTCCLDEYNKEDSDLNINIPIRNIFDIEVILIPTLSELIEACADGFYSLLKVEEGFSAVAIGARKCYYLGSSPEEAVAKLWLELNKK